MTGRDDPGEGQRPMPPIPDGGLSQTMPDWLRRPPAWRSSPASQIEPTIEPPDRNDATVLATSVLPPLDDSVIDPRELILAADLPAWLRSLGVPQPSVELTTQPSVGPIVYRPADQRSAISPTDHLGSAHDHEDVGSVPENIGADASRTAFRPRRLAIPNPVPVVTIPARSALEPETAAIPRLTIALAVALGIAILIIVGLLAL